MIVGQRILARLPAVGLSQAELARRVGISQGAMNNLIAGRSRSSTHLHKIARHLATTPAYLSGEIDDPNEGAPPPSEPRVQHIMMPVVLPSENALAAMFEGLLEAVDRSAPVDELARELAQLLPSGLSQVRGRLIEGAATVEQSPREAAEALATADRGSSR